MNYYERHKEICKIRALMWYNSNREHCIERMKTYNQNYYKRKKTPYQQLIEDKQIKKGDSLIVRFD